MTCIAWKDVRNYMSTGHFNEVLAVSQDADSDSTPCKILFTRFVWQSLQNWCQQDSVLYVPPRPEASVEMYFEQSEQLQKVLDASSSAQQQENS
jgi:predicted amidophosphoribosyltransferase